MSFEASKNKLLSIGPFGSKEGDDIWDDGVHSTAKSIKVGPFGGSGGDVWDDGVHSTVRRVVICHLDYFIRNIQFEYDDDGKSVWSDKYGLDKSGVNNIEKVELDYPDEFLTSIQGKYISNFISPTFICSLTFKSNQKTYGPYGTLFSSEGGWGKCFSIQMTGHKIVGFHGKHTKWMWVRAIGAHLKPIDHYHQKNPEKDVVKSKPANKLIPFNICDSPQSNVVCHQKNQEKDDDKPNTLPTPPNTLIPFNIWGNPQFNIYNEPK